MSWTPTNNTIVVVSGNAAFLIEDWHLAPGTWHLAPGRLAPGA